MNLQLEKTINNLPKITEERKQTLTPLIDYIQEKKNDNETINLNFICTHNSRRSHLSQIWAQTMAYHFNISNLYSYSGGTEVTNLNSNVINTLEKNGFEVHELAVGDNPIYAIKYDKNSNSIIGFSKKFDDKFNPVSSFCAILTCSQADEGCPFIAGAEKRIPVTYEDPKLFDNTEFKDEKYLKRSLQIASEMYYVFSNIN